MLSSLRSNNVLLQKISKIALEPKSCDRRVKKKLHTKGSANTFALNKTVFKVAVDVR